MFKLRLINSNKLKKLILRSIFSNFSKFICNPIIRQVQKNPLNYDLSQYILCPGCPKEKLFQILINPINNECPLMLK